MFTLSSLVKHCFICNVYFYRNSNNPVVLGPNNSNLPRIFSIIADGEIHEAIKHEDPCTKRLANVVRQVQVNTFFLIHKGEHLGFAFRSIKTVRLVLRALSP